jgi:hypothetical protein
MQVRQWEIYFLVSCLVVFAGALTKTFPGKHFSRTRMNSSHCRYYVRLVYSPRTAVVVDFFPNMIIFLCPDLCENLDWKDYYAGRGAIGYD